MEPKIIYQDKQIIVLDKPSGMVVNRSETVKGETLQDWLEKRFKIYDWRFKNKNDFYRRSGIVHRLDKETSGLLIVAKTPQSFLALQKQFKEREVVKKYLALVHDRLEPKCGDIKLPLARKPKDRKKFDIRLKGKEGITKYNRLAVYYAPNKKIFSLVELSPRTGRTHQLRVHLKHIGHPIVADLIYLGKKRLKEDLQWCPRLFLHAKYLSFIHPETSEKMTFKIDLPADLRNIITQLKKNSLN